LPFLNEQAFVGRDATPWKIYKGEFRVKALRNSRRRALSLETSKFSLYFSGSCIPSNESLFILLTLPTQFKMSYLKRVSVEIVLLWTGSIREGVYRVWSSSPQFAFFKCSSKCAKPLPDCIYVRCLQVLRKYDIIIL
jgi:hypothetical protein